VKQILCKEWGIKPWEMEKLTSRDLQDVWLAEHTETYIQQRQRERQEGQRSGSVSKREYDASKSRQKAFQ